MSAVSAHKVFPVLVLLALVLQPLAVTGRQVDKETSRQGNEETSRQGVVAPATSGLFRTTVTVDSPSRRARRDALPSLLRGGAGGEVCAAMA